MHGGPTEKAVTDHVTVLRYNIGEKVRSLCRRFALVRGRKYFGNTGSVGQPRDSDPRVPHVQAQNPFCFTKFKGMDPEVGSSSGFDGWAKGIDLGYYPQAKGLLVGLNLKF